MEWKVDTLFTFDNGISSDILFGDTPLPSLSSEMTFTVSSGFNRTSLDDGLRTPELTSFTADDYSNNCEILNEQLLTDVNPSLQITTHNIIDSSNIDPPLLENQCNGYEMGKSESFQQKEMDISFYSNLDSISEIPGISSMKSMENNFDTSKSLESLFEIEKEIQTLPCINNDKKDIENTETMLPETSIARYHKIITDNDYKLSDDKSFNMYSSQNSASQYDSNKNCQIGESVSSKNSFKEEINFDLNTKNENEELTIMHPNYFLTSDPSFSKSCCNKENENNSDIGNSMFSFPKDSSESIETIMAAEFAICQMIEAISDSSQTIEVADNKKFEIKNISDDDKFELINSEELVDENKNSENTKIYVNSISHESNDCFMEENVEIEFVPHDEESKQNEEYKTFSASENNNISYINEVSDGQLFNIANLDCFVCLERLDESFIKSFISSREYEKMLSCQKSKCSSSKFIKMNMTKLSTEKKEKPKCNICKRHYSSLASLEIHKCKKRKSSTPQCVNNKISQQTSNIIKHFKCTTDNNSFNENELLQNYIKSHCDFNSAADIVKSEEKIWSDFENKDLSKKTEEIFWKYDKDLLCCQKCQQTFHNYSVLIQHLCYMHTNHFKECEFCKHKFKSGGNIMNHMSHHTNQMIYNCKLCSFKCSFQEELDRHILIYHTSLKNSNVELKPCSVQLEILDLKMS